MRLTRARLGLGCLAVGVLAILTIGVGAVLFGFLQYRTTAGPTPGETPSPQVAIGSPVIGLSSTVGEPIDVVTQATGFDPLLSTELWVNGVLTGVQAAPIGGILPLNAEFSWIPAQPGAYSLVARVMDIHGRSVSSHAVQVFIAASDGALPGLQEANSDPIVLPASPSTGIPVPPPSDAAIGPATPWQGTPGEWLTHLTALSPPQAPELLVSVDGCAATLSIHDLSANEESFVLYRQSPNSPVWIEIARLGSQGQHEWLTYTDSGLHGQRTYYVSAFNSQGEAVSNLAQAIVDPEDCPPPTQNLPVLMIGLSEMAPSVAADQVYCYKSLGGQHWSRWPETGFYAPGADNAGNMPQLEQVLLNDLEGVPLFESLTFYLECWGWAGGDLHFLGESSRVIDPENPQDLQLEDAGFSANLPIQIINLYDPPLFPLEEGTSSFSGDPQSFPAFQPSSAQMPLVIAAITYDPAECTQHLEPTAQNALGSLFLCQPFPGYNIGPGGANPQPYMVWRLFDDMCSAGSDQDCLTQAWWLQYAGSLGGSVFWDLRVEDPDVAGHYTFPQLEPLRTVYKTDCAGEERLLRVRMVVYLPEGNISIRGPWSNWATLPCQEEIIDRVNIEVTFETLHLTNVDDGDSGVQDVEVYGFFWADPSGGSGKGVHFGVHPLAAGCDHEESVFGADASKGAFFCFKELGAGSHSLNGMHLCWLSSKDYWTTFCSSDFSDYGFANNSQVITVRDGDAIFLQVRLYDYDGGSSDDPVCVRYLWVDGRPLSQWASTTNESVSLTANHDNADCQLDVVLNAVTP